MNKSGLAHHLLICVRIVINCFAAFVHTLGYYLSLKYCQVAAQDHSHGSMGSLVSHLGFGNLFVLRN